MKLVKHIDPRLYEIKADFDNISLSEDEIDEMWEIIQLLNGDVD